MDLYERLETIEELETKALELHRLYGKNVFQNPSFICINRTYNALVASLQNDFSEFDFFNINCIYELLSEKRNDDGIYDIPEDYPYP